MTREAGSENSSLASEGQVLPWTLAGALRCPCCGSRVDVSLEVKACKQGLEAGILRCDCYEYPVVRGIAVLRQLSPVSTTLNEAVERLRDRDPEGATRWLVAHGAAAGVPGTTETRKLKDVEGRHRWRMGKLFHRGAPSRSANVLLAGQEFPEALRAARPAGYASYLFHRFANPSLLGVIPALVVLADTIWAGSTGLVLDLLCGVGHASAILHGLQPAANIVLADVDFVNLLLARHFMVPSACAVCLDAELPLPFTDSIFAGVCCLDGLHYIHSKVALLTEVNRVAGAGSAWLFGHLHNATGHNENPGAPLTAAGYMQRFSFGSHRLIPEARILADFQANGSLDLTIQPDADAITGSDVVTLLGARTGALWKRHAGLDDVVSRRADRLSLNPIYAIQDRGDGVVLKAAWPNDSLRRECTGRVAVPPDAVEVPREVLGDIARWKGGGTLSAQVRELIRSFVLVPLPECYPKARLLA